MNNNLSVNSNGYTRSDKHAFLIIAHNNEKNLINLIKSIDHDNNDIFIHIDKKWKSFDRRKVESEVKHSNVHIYSKFSVTWGGWGQIRTEMFLFEKSLNTDSYVYFHLLSGQDICIKPQNFVHEFFDKNRGKEFLSFSGKDWQDRAQSRVKYYHIECGRNRIKRLANKAFVKVQKILHIDRRKKRGLIFVGGSNWVSITENFCRHLVDNKKFILKTFKKTYCADELFVHTMAYNSEFKKDIYMINEKELNDDADIDMCYANMRKIDWVRGKPYTFDCDDFDDIINSPFIFIRKVDDSNGLSDKILQYLNLY